MDAGGLFYPDIALTNARTDTGYTQDLNIRIYAFGPWQTPTEDPTICARYVIGQSPQAFHWDTEFVIAHDEDAVSYGIKKSCFRQHPELLSWSPPSTFVEQAIKCARRCISIQAQNILLDTTSKIKLTLQPGQVRYLDIDQITIDKHLVYSIENEDLQRIALYNGYLTWSEFETGSFEFSML